MPKTPHDDLFEKSTMTFGEHLEELRVCLFRSVIGVAGGCLIGFFVANSVVRFFQSPLEKAMERYYVDKALGDLANAYGTVSYEVRRMILDEKIVPDPLQIEVGQLTDSLRLAYPEQFADLAISPYWFTEGDLLREQAADMGAATRLAQALQSAGAGLSDSPTRRMWQLLGEPQQKELAAIAASASATREEATKVLSALNQLAGESELHSSPEFQRLAGPDKAQMESLRKELSAAESAAPTRRLNKLLIASLFPRELRTARVNLLALFTWRPVKVRFQVLNAQEAFMIWMKAALVTGLVIASPYVFYQVWIFIAAGLYPHEKNYVFLYMPISLLLFFGGASLAFVFVFQPVLDFLFTFNKGMNADFDPRIGEWLGFVLILPLGFGISFQLPLVMLLLNRLGVVSIDLYVQQWRIAVLTIFVIAMVLTPADPVSMLLMAAPLCLLYLLGIIMCKYMPQRKSPFAAAYEP